MSGQKGWLAGVEITSGVYKPRDPRTTALYEVVRDNLETQYGAIEDGAIAVRGCCRRRGRARVAAS